MEKIMNTTEKAYKEILKALNKYKSEILFYVNLSYCAVQHIVKVLYNGAWINLFTSGRRKLLIKYIDSHIF
jgi:hypothetical protein